VARDARLTRLQDQVVQDIDHLMDGLAGGQLSPLEWAQRMEDTITEAHVAAYLLANPNPVPPDLRDSDLGRFIATQLDYLDGFYQDVEAGDPGDPSWAPRARMYARAVTTSYSMGATNGWPLPVHPGQDTDCLSNCKCEWDLVVIDASRGDADAYWERHANDSCDSCREYGARYYPLRIRGGRPVR